MTAADKQEIGLLKNYIASILPNMLDLSDRQQNHQSNPEDEQTLGRPQGN